MYRPPLKSVICSVLERPDMNTHTSSHLQRMAESRKEGRERNRDVVCHSLTRPTSMSANLSLISQASLGQLVCFSSIK